MPLQRSDLAADEAWRASLERSRGRRVVAARRRRWRLRRRGAIAAGLVSTVGLSGVAMASTGGVRADSGQSHKTKSNPAMNAELKKIAQCESGDDPRAVSPDHRYYGLYQFDLGTWHSLGGKKTPIDWSGSTQTRFARKLYRERGTAPWPNCA